MAPEALHHSIGPSQLPPWSTQLGEFQSGQDDEQGRGKRSRVALACQRCKTRKQKCDGSQPCSKCRNNNLECEYVVPQKPMPFGKNNYIKSLERRVAELETILSSQGMAELSSDHWKVIASSAGTSVQTEAAASEGNSNHQSPESVGSDEPVLDWQDGVDPVVSVLRSLSLDVNGSGYMGASSHVALGRLFNFLGRGRTHNGAAHHQSRRQSVNMPSPSRSADEEEPIDFADVPSAVADRLFAGYQKHIATRWPVIHSVWAREVHQRRYSLTDNFEITMLHLVYATAGRFIETTGESGDFHAKRHYAAAVQPLDTILEYNDIRTVQALMLMAIYCLRDSVGPGAWTYSRTALLIAIDHGLHRQTKALSRVTMENQLRKRLFWSCYAFDRQISIPMGRPFGISDRDIDIELPLDINENTTEEQLAGKREALLGSRLKSTSLTSFVLIARLRQIESDIQQTIYRVDQTAMMEDSVIAGFLTRLEEWKTMIPQDTHRFKDTRDVPFDGYDFYLVFYYKCQRLLLYPHISESSVTPRYLRECAKACAGVCGAYKRLHQALAVGYSLMALQTVFMAGLTLVYCIWISPDDIFDLTTSNGIHDCSIILFVIAERVHSAKKYRNAFEVIRQRVIDQISRAPERRSREAVPGLTAELAPSAHSFQVDMPFGVDNGSFEEFSRIITDITGEDFAGGINRLGSEAPGSTLDFDFNSVFRPSETGFEAGPTFDGNNLSPTFDYSMENALRNGDTATFLTR